MIYELWLALFPHALNPFGQQSSDDKMWLERMGLKRTKSKASLSPTSVSRLIPELLPGLSTETVISLKTKGNEYFGKEAYDKAEIEYTKALDCFARSPAGDAMERDWTPSPMDDSDSDNLIGLGTSLLSNRSAALLHLGNWTGSIRDATQVIILRPSWVKGYFRRAEALHAQKEFSTALIDYQTAINCDPLNVTLQCKAKTTAVKVQEDKDGLLIRQLQTGREICQKSLFSPVQSLVFDYAVKMQNYIYFVVRFFVTL